VRRSMGMQWFTDLVVRRKPKPTNIAPGLIYMLNGAAQHSYTDPFDRTSPLIPIGPHWMLIWPFDAEASGLSTEMRDAGTMIMFAGTPYAHLHICGDPWAGNEYHPGDKAVSGISAVAASICACSAATFRAPHQDAVPTAVARAGRCPPQLPRAAHRPHRPRSTD
jgi:hypothetical protein